MFAGRLRMDNLPFCTGNQFYIFIMLEPERWAEMKMNPARRRMKPKFAIWETYRF